MSIIIDEDTTVLVQGITGKEGIFHAEKCLDYCTKIVCGVTPGKGGTKILGNIEVYENMKIAVKETNANTSLVFVPPAFSPDAIFEAVDAGIKTIVTDHHLAETDLLPPGIVINPNHPECKYSFKKISGCGVALKLVMALRKSLRKLDWWTSARPEPNLRNSLDLAALGTVADVVPLLDENRIITYHGLKVMNDKPRLAIQVLKSLKKVETITSRTLAFQFGPLMNAAGRLKDADMAVRFLLSNDKKEAEKMAQILDATNDERREKESEMIQTAL